ncbi:MAG: EAL domain-containing protein [Lachnospiraceae bacterium]|nr:EAL domain-containing protein [Lachnospiraceae bacterium]
MQHDILYFDMCAVPIYLIIWFTAVNRKMTRGRTNVLFLVITVMGLLTVISDLAAGIPMQEYPLTEFEIKLVKISEYIYFALRNGTNALYLFYMISVTRTWYRIRPLWKKLLLLAPYLGILGLIVSNETTHQIFTVTADNGYTRGPQIVYIYILAAFYLVFGTIYLCFCKKTMDFGAWLAIATMYIMNSIAIVIQFMYGYILIECYFTSLSMFFVVLFVQRPEKRVDISTGIPGYRAFCEEIAKIRATKQDVQIIIVSLTNAYEMNKYLGEKQYVKYIHVIEEQVRTFAKRDGLSYELYFEHPGTFYILMEDTDYNPVQAIPEVRDRVRDLSGEAVSAGARPDTRIVEVTFPKEISEVDELLQFGHNFVRFAPVDRLYIHAEDILKLKEYQIETHMNEILDRAIDADALKVFYHPIYSEKEQKFLVADAVVRLTDEQFGTIDAKTLIHAAEEKGVIMRLGYHLMELVFAAIQEGFLTKNGYNCVNINLSVLQCMQMDFTDRVWELRERYGVHPEQVCFSIKESEYENMSDVLDENLRKLSTQGYFLALDGFGKGYTNMQHILELPIKAVRLDKSMIASADTEGGKAILKGSIRMLREVPLTVIATGVDDKETAEKLAGLGCDLMQGLYYDASAPV